MPAYYIDEALKDGMPLKTWLELALARYSLGGVSIGEISKQFLTVSPKPEPSKAVPPPCAHNWIDGMFPFCLKCKGLGDPETGQIFVTIPEPLLKLRR